MKNLKINKNLLIGGLVLTGISLTGNIIQGLDNRNVSLENAYLQESVADLLAMNDYSSGYDQGYTEGKIAGDVQSFKDVLNLSDDIQIGIKHNNSPDNINYYKLNDLYVVEMDTGNNILITDDDGQLDSSHYKNLLLESSLDIEFVNNNVLNYQSLKGYIVDNYEKMNTNGNLIAACLDSETSKTITFDENNFTSKIREPIKQSVR